MFYHTRNRSFWIFFRSRPPHLPPHLPRLVWPDRYQPRFVRRCPITQQLLPILRLLDWDVLPASLADRKQGQRFIPLAAYISAYLVRLEHQPPSFAALRRFLASHPALIWALGFPIVASKRNQVPIPLHSQASSLA
jgi:hypothetical protein